MRLLLSVAQAEGPDRDVSVSADPTATVGDVASALLRGLTPPSARPASPTLAVMSEANGMGPLDPQIPLAEASVGSGDRVAIRPAEKTTRSGLQAKVLEGPDAGRWFILRNGVNVLGRSPECDVALTDPLVSKRHARIIVASNVEVVDDNSANGLVSSGMVVQRLVLAEGDRFQVGDSVLIVEGLAARSAAPESTPVTVAFNRSPRLDPDFVGQEFTAPEAPVPQPIPVFPMVSALIPLVMAAAFILAHQPLASLIFLVMTPAMAAGGYFQGRRTAQRNFEADVTRFEQNLAELVAELRSGLDAERSGRVHEHPATADIVVGVQQLSPLLWARRPGDARFLSLRLGLGTQSSRSTVEVPRGRNAPVDLQRQLDASVKPLQVVDNVPVTCHLPSEGPLGVAGPADVREGSRLASSDSWSACTLPPK